MNIVLYEPEIPGNTGNIGRSCVATGSTLHLIGPLGFKIEDKEIKRSGLDYWPKLKFIRHQDWETFRASVPPQASLIFFTTHAKMSFWEAPYQADSYLIFGRESSGLPQALLAEHEAALYRIPIGPDVRSLNLSSAAAVALYEGMRRTGWAAVTNPQSPGGKL